MSKARSAENHVLCGHELKVSKQPYLFDAKRCKHFTGQWKGAHLVLVAFSACNFDRLPHDAITRLSPLGFRLPSPNDGFPSALFSCKGLRDVRVVHKATGDMPKVAGKRDFDPEPSVPAPLSSEPLLFIEACCGSATLAAAAKQAGFEVMAIDHPQNRRDPAIKRIHLDLRASAAWVFLDHVREHGRLFHFHISPPCGTASRARELPNSPGPLRSFEFPCGLPGLTAVEQAKGPPQMRFTADVPTSASSWPRPR